MDYQYYITPSDYAKALSNGISYNLLTKRVRDYAWGIERATTTPPQSHSKWNGWLEVAKQNGISHSTFYTRINRDEMSPEKAATTPITPQHVISQKMSEKTRIYPKKYADMAIANGISRYAFVERMSRGWEPLDAATRPIDTSRWSKEKKEMARK